MEKESEQKTDQRSNERRQEQQPTAPQFLKSIVSPLDRRVEMGNFKLPKMCSCFSYGS